MTSRRRRGSWRRRALVAVAAGVVLSGAGWLPASAAGTTSREIATRTAAETVAVVCPDLGEVRLRLPHGVPDAAATVVPGGPVSVAGSLGLDAVDGRTGAPVRVAPAAGLVCAALPASGTWSSLRGEQLRPAGVRPDDVLSGVVLVPLRVEAPAAPAPRAGVRSTAVATGFPYAADLQAYLRSRPGVTSLALQVPGDARVYTLRPEVTAITASIVKLDIMAAVLRRAQDQRRALNAWEQSQLTPMITASDNSAATALWNSLGGGPAVAQLNALVPLASTVMGPGGYWGLTTTTAADQVALLGLFAAPNAVLSDASRAYGLGLMHQVRTDQAWGVTAGPPAGAVAVKNGWLPRADGWHVNSGGVVSAGPTRYTVSVLTASGTASMGDQVATIQGVSNILWRRQVVAPYGAIGQRYDALGGAGGFLGLPRTAEQAAPDGRGRYQAFPGGSISWSPTSGAHEVHGAVEVTWAAWGREAGTLGYPTTDESPTPDGVGRYNHFEGRGLPASVYWSPSTGGHAVWGAVRQAWQQLGWEAGPVGYPTTDELPTPDGRARVQDFAGHGLPASICWTPATGAHAVYGAVRTAWQQLGGEAGPLGPPTTDERDTAGRTGRYQDFSGTGPGPTPVASVYWTPSTGAVSVQGPVRSAWLAAGGADGLLGVPVREPREDGPGRTRSDFQHGYLVYDATAGSSVITLL